MKVSFNREERKRSRSADSLIYDWRGNPHANAAVRNGMKRKTFSEGTVRSTPTAESSGCRGSIELDRKWRLQQQHQFITVTIRPMLLQAAADA
ncbi:hypothetical protein R1flu_028017 [Riccia fluitans]|uniref:Uncharacterized protein n=1 Tax=Riccia fluitans TaxID=41844 RepID=A0ABD1XKG5_9MARC